MTNVIEGKFGSFKPKQELVYQCPFCDSGRTFYLCEDPGVIQCIACSSRQEIPPDWMEGAHNRFAESDDE